MFRLLLAALTLSSSFATAAPFVDVLATPSQASARAAKGLFNGLALAGTRIVAAGQRGHVLYSDNGGVAWSQATVPVSSDLVAVTFPSAREGWAVGHDGVVLHSSDGGAHWQRQLDGRSAARLVALRYRADAARAILVQEADAVAASGPDKPFLDVYFENVNDGFVVGAFGHIFRTEDGGKSWAPWHDRVANPKGFHLYAMRAIGGELYIVGEQGLVLKRSTDKARFEALRLPYQGSLFGLVGDDNAVLVFGLRGNAWRSVDHGATWSKVETASQAGLTGGCVLPDGRLVLVSQAGQVLISADSGASFQPMASAKPGATSAAIAAGAGQLVLAGPRGLRGQVLK